MELPQLSVSVWPLVTTEGLPVHLTWRAHGADEVRLLTSGERLAPGGSKDVQLTASGDIAVEAVNGRGNVVARTAHVVVVPRASTTFTVDEPPSSASADDLLRSDGPGAYALSSLLGSWNAQQLDAATGTFPPVPAAADAPTTTADAARGHLPVAAPPPAPLPVPGAVRPVEVRGTADLDAIDAPLDPRRRGDAW